MAAALGAGIGSSILVSQYPRAASREQPTRSGTWLSARRDPATAEGLALSAALVVTVGGGTLLALLTYLVRANDVLLDGDSAVARWGHAHASRISTIGLHVVTQLGGAPVILGLAGILIAIETRRLPSALQVLFLLTVTLGNFLVTTALKALIGRARPAFNPFAATLGPSFPSGHSTAAAAFYAAAALLLVRRRTRPARALAAGVAVGVAVAVAGSRVLLDDHWLSDVIAGLALGWAWFAGCAIAFGGRMLEFGVSLDGSGVGAYRGTSEP